MFSSLPQLTDGSPLKHVSIALKRVMIKGVREGILLGGGKNALKITICHKNKQFALKLTFPDQSHYDQSRLWSRLHTTLAQINGSPPSEYALY